MNNRETTAGAVVREDIYVCDIEQRVDRGREQFRYSVHRRLTAPGTEIVYIGRWSGSRALVEKRGRKRLTRQERSVSSSPRVIGQLFTADPKEET